MASAKGGLLARSDFPLYAVKALDERHFLVAGGGGAAKTGIANAIEVYEVKFLSDKAVAGSICRHDTGTKSIMNGCNVYDGRNHIFAAGLDDECHIYSLKYKVTSPDKNEKGSNDVRQRKSGNENSANKEEEEEGTKQIQFDIEEIKQIKTDFHKESGFQKAVQFSRDHSILATGGSDGYLRVWKYPSMEKVFEVAAHKSDVDDIDISPDGQKIVTVSRDHCGFVWKSKDGSKIKDLNGPQEYRFRACRYGLIEGKKDKFNLYTISIPVKRSQKPQPCYLTLWDSESFRSKGNQETGTEVLSSLALSEDGVYAAVGTISGSVAVYISFSLKKLYYVKEAHSIFVTGLAFMPSSEAAQAITGSQDFTLLSISADNTIRLHQVAPRGSYSAALVVVLFICFITLIFWLISELGL
ncbi:guanine nucleotide-exchange factor SEC12 [Magallana gigas]|uniref:guanine nucleotide-exchange factor SEC12 n=1 Tax=Magallana gigas TaxID=29159 RepID=UPI00333F7DF4